MKRWEYHIETVLSGNMRQWDLEKLGNDGWELVNMIYQKSQSREKWIFKREINEKN